MHPLEHYLTHLAAIRNTGAGTPETSYYPPLAELLNAIGHTLKPKVRAVNQLSNIKLDCSIFDCSHATQRAFYPEIIKQVNSIDRVAQ